MRKKENLLNFSGKILLVDSVHSIAPLLTWKCKKCLIIRSVFDETFLFFYSLSFDKSNRKL